jgi:hypothetical protein
MAREAGLAGAGVAFMEALEKEVREIIKPLPIDIDGALAALRRAAPTGDRITWRDSPLKKKSRSHRSW